MKDKKLRFKRPESEEKKRERIAILMKIGCDECRASFITWAEGDTWLDICGMFRTKAVNLFSVQLYVHGRHGKLHG